MVQMRQSDSLGSIFRYFACGSIKLPLSSSGCLLLNDGFGSWVGVSVLSIEQEKLGASFKKMCERFLSNTTAGVLR